MSGIAGLFAKDGAEVASEELERMAARIAHRGPDADGSWSDGSVGLAHRAAWTTPRARAEVQPRVDPDGFVVTADARIDNREELTRSLDITGEPGELGDADLVLRAYRRWGAACPLHLVGDFAFAIWDPRSRELFCARDPFGVKPFYYYDSPQLFTFGSELKAILALERVPRRLDEVRVGYFLENVPLDEERTFYEDIRRLPPGCRLVVDHEESRRQRYYSFLDVRLQPPASDEEYVEEYQRRFHTAVRDRTDGDVGVGSMLSGGLDSSSIVCAARERLLETGRDPLPTFSLVFDDVPESDERPFIEAVLAGGHVQPHFVRGDTLPPFGEWDAMLDDLDEAAYGANLFLNRALYRTARSAGVRVLLDGVDGDSVVGYGFERLAELARRGRLPTLAREVFLTARVLEISPWRIFNQYVRRPLVRGLRASAPAWSRRAWRRIRGRADRPAEPIRLAPTTDPEFARRVELRDRIEALNERHRRATDAATSVLAAGLISGVPTSVLELMDRSSAAAGVECRYPFFDRRLVELCLGLPSRMRLQRGFSRFIERQAGTSLPPEVRWRSWKGDLSHNFVRALERYEGERVEEVVRSAASCLGGYVAPGEVAKAHRRFLASRSAADAFEISKVVGLALWMRHTGVRR